MSTRPTTPRQSRSDAPKPAGGSTAPPPLKPSTSAGIAPLSPSVRPGSIPPPPNFNSSPPPPVFTPPPPPLAAPHVQVQPRANSHASIVTSAQPLHGIGAGAGPAIPVPRNLNVSVSDAAALKPDVPEYRSPQGSLSGTHPGTQGGARPPVDPTYTRIWLRTQSREWTSLAVIGSSAKSPAATMKVAEGLARVFEELGQQIVVIDGRGTDLRALVPTKARLRSLAQRGQRVIIALPLPQSNPLTVAITQVVDAALLCVFIGESRSIVCRQAIDQIGRARFLGTVALRNS